MMTCSSIINSLGLILDIFGAILLLRYGIPNKVDPEGTMYRTISGTDSGEIEKGKLFKKWSNFAVILLIGGFLLQLVSNFVHN